VRGTSNKIGGSIHSRPIICDRNSDREAGNSRRRLQMTDGSEDDRKIDIFEMLNSTGPSSIRDIESSRRHSKTEQENMWTDDGEHSARRESKESGDV
jgi:hypothetical protein